MFSFLNRLFTLKNEKKKAGGELPVPVLSPERTKKQSSMNNQAKNIVLKRAGKDIFIIDDDTRLLSQATLAHLTSHVTSKQVPMRIRTFGLSRAQVGKIAGSFLSNAESDNITVEVQQLSINMRYPNLDKSPHQAQSFEIIVQGGDKIADK